MAAITAVVWVVGFGVLWWRVEPLLRRIMAERSARRSAEERQQIRDRARQRTIDWNAMMHTDRRLDLVERRMAVRERMAMIAEKRADFDMTRPEKPVGPKFEPMPADLRQFCLSENQPWARDDKVQRANELYAQFGDWNQVRQVLY